MIRPEDNYLLFEKIVAHHLKDLKEKGILTKRYLKKFEEIGLGLDGATYEPTKKNIEMQK